MAKINVSMPDALLQEVDALAADADTSRSGFVAEATANYVAHILHERAETERRERIERAISDARRIGERVGEWDSTAAIRRERDRGHEDAPQ
jgi:metal-responsive CopG/Arc/MetJ family transcriptional regulator